MLTLDLRAQGRWTGAIEDCAIARWAADITAPIDALGIGPAVSVVGGSLGPIIHGEDDLAVSRGRD